MKNMNHIEYPKSLRGKSREELAFTIKDATEALHAMPHGGNAEYYADEIHYCVAELNRRKNEGVLLDRNGVFGKMYVVEYGWTGEARLTKKFATEGAAFTFADSVLACLRDVYIEYTQRHSIREKFFTRG